MLITAPEQQAPEGRMVGEERERQNVPPLQIKERWWRKAVCCGMETRRGLAYAQPACQNTLGSSLFLVKRAVVISERTQEWFPGHT